MSVNKIKEWLDSYGIKIDINPTLTLFGLISFSLINTELRPAKFSGKEVENVSDFITANEEFFTSFIQKTVKITLDEFKKNLEEEKKGKSEEEVKGDVKVVYRYLKDQKEIKENLDLIINTIKESPTQTVEEFERIYNKQMRIPYEFMGRENEIRELHEFLESDDEPIRLIIGEGGFGKTRLAIEFAKQVEKRDDWDVYFIHSINRFIKSDLEKIEKNTLYILDEPSRYQDRDNLFYNVIFHDNKDFDLKLILVDRAIFKETLLNEIREKGRNVQIKRLEKGDIETFLSDNYKDLSNEIIKDIVEKCEGNFVYATFYAEYFKDKRKIVDLKDVLSHKLSKYIIDINKETGKNINCPSH